MPDVLEISLAVSILAAFAAIMLGRNLTRSILAGHVFLAALAFALIIAGTGFPAIVARSHHRSSRSK